MLAVVFSRCFPSPSNPKFGNGLVTKALTIHEELNFSWTASCIQGLGQVFECVKIMLQALILTSAGRRLVALTKVLLVMPLCFACLSVSFGFSVYDPHEHL